MPDKDAHLDQARHNRDFFETLDLNTYGDWATTVIFYEAIQYIDAHLADSYAEHPRTYGDYRWAQSGERDGYIQNYMRTIWPDYRELKDASRDARYECVIFSQDEVEEHLALLENIRSWISNRLS